MNRANLIGVLATLVLASSLGGCQCVLGLQTPQPYPTGGGGTGGSDTTLSDGGGGAAPMCSDETKNGNETDVDCGGGACPPCAVGEGCIVGPDCETNACLAGTCVAPGCADKIKNGMETDVDCGGPLCPNCANGLSCGVDDDCQSGVCKMGICQDYHVWSSYFTADEFTAVAGLSADGAGNVFLALNLGGTVNLGGDSLATEGMSDVVIAKFDPGGAHLWSTVFGDMNAQTVEGIAADAGGGVVFTGTLSGTANFGGEPLTSAGGCCPASPDIVIVKLDSDGKHVWSKNFGNVSPQQGLGVTSDSSGAVVVAGLLQGSANFGGGTLTSAGQADVFVSKFDSDGNHAWSKRYGEGGDQYAQRVVADSSGNVIVAGAFAGTLDFGDGPVPYAGELDVFVAKLDPSGNILWKRGYGSALDESTVSLGIDGAGNIVVAGTFHETINFGGGALTSQGGADYFVLRLDPDGNHVWSDRFGDSLDQSGIAVAGDALGNALLTGGLLGSIDFGGGQMASAGEKDIFVAKLDVTGEHVWGRRFGDEAEQTSTAIAAHGTDTVFFAGTFDGTLDLGDGPVASVSGNDIFVGRLLLP